MPPEMLRSIDEVVADRLVVPLSRAQFIDVAVKFFLEECNASIPGLPLEGIGFLEDFGITFRELVLLQSCWRVGGNRHFLDITEALSQRKKPRPGQKVREIPSASAISRVWSPKEAKAIEQVWHQAIHAASMVGARLP
ncbi:MAG: hypothetical protein AABX89_03925 [Candidatus Thermoplasmatota archaeon]